MRHVGRLERCSSARWLGAAGGQLVMVGQHTAVASAGGGSKVSPRSRRALEPQQRTFESCRTALRPIPGLHQAATGVLRQDEGRQGWSGEGPRGVGGQLWVDTPTDRPARSSCITETQGPGCKGRRGSRPPNNTHSPRVRGCAKQDCRAPAAVGRSRRQALAGWSTGQRGPLGPQRGPACCASPATLRYPRSEMWPQGTFQAAWAV